MAISGQTYTPVSNTTQGQLFDQISKALAAIKVSPPTNTQGLSDSYADATSQSMQAAYGAPQQVESARQTMTQQSSIPNLIGQYGDLGKIFEMYLADSELASKYQPSTQYQQPYENAAVMASAQGNGQIGGQVGAAPNPYLASADVLANSAQGFQSPDLTTAMMGAPAQGASSLMSTLSSLIGSQQGLVDSKTKDFGELTAGKINVLDRIANALGSAITEGQKSSNEGLDLGDLLGTGTETSQDEGFQHVAWVKEGGEDYARRYAERLEKEQGGAFAYKETPYGWEILKSATATGEESQKVRMVNFETGDEVEVDADDATAWALKGYDEY